MNKKKPDNKPALPVLPATTVDRVRKLRRRVRYPLYTESDFVKDIGKCVNVSRDKIIKIFELQKLIIEEKLCQYEAVMTPVGIMRLIRKPGGANGFHYGVIVEVDPRISSRLIMVMAGLEE